MCPTNLQRSSEKNVVRFALGMRQGGACAARVLQFCFERRHKMKRSCKITGLKGSNLAFLG